jgi:hypothetical protein
LPRTFWVWVWVYVSVCSDAHYYIVNEAIATIFWRLRELFLLLSFVYYRTREAEKESLTFFMTAAENEILSLLQELQKAVGQMATANPKPDLRPIFAKLAELTKVLPKDTDPQLLHFLHRGSYEKAQQWLEAMR